MNKAEKTNYERKAQNIREGRTNRIRTRAEGGAKGTYTVDTLVVICPFETF